MQHAAPLSEERIAFGRDCLARGDFPGALRAARDAATANGAGAEASLFLIEALVHAGGTQEALGKLERLAWDSQNDVLLLQRIAQIYTFLNRHDEALRYNRRAVALAPNNPAAHYNLATALIALGELDEAEKTFDRVIDLAPQDYDAYYNRATLRRQTTERNHVEALRRALNRGDARGDVALNYALAKELEDLGDYKDSFQHLTRGAGARRSRLAYRVEDDTATMQEIAGTFDGRFFGTPRPGHVDKRPVFILGLPRSGTTLIDRILSSHPDVQSLGELSNFAVALVRQAGPSGGKRDLVKRCRSLDFAALGEAYSHSIDPISGAAARLIDKTPVNFLYLGLIASALPGATIIHVRRNPMDVCYAMYKTLFRMAYPFSYDLADLGRYYLAYRGLMEHWRSVLPGRFLDVAYEDLVANQADVSRQIVEHCGLAWNTACLSFEKNPGASLTASAAQVRQPIYSSSVGLWRRYATQLQPLYDGISAAGLDPESP
jgi:tetratricopeptide (TPR) repeat protein